MEETNVTVDDYLSVIYHYCNGCLLLNKGVDAQTIIDIINGYYKKEGKVDEEEVR